MKICPDCKTVNLPHLQLCKHCGGEIYRSKTKQYRLGRKIILDFLNSRLS